jgi:hypothetical protein
VPVRQASAVQPLPAQAQVQAVLPRVAVPVLPLERALRPQGPALPPQGPAPPAPPLARRPR